MRIQKFGPNELFPEVKKRLITTNIVLDIGCGINPQQMIIPEVNICCEPFQEYLDHLQTKVKNLYDRIF
ncbi:MAG: hypothetical protein COX02_01850 [Candidatus Vogelbacteria bacterium CG22_combo_CG10-13_8_21_14_all_37_9]|uniref:SAM-dependent methyltransferase n=1 Tax=Candidatus Vogelbacteria bacterium CG22_combo_CG10-13_8_21_14_all_37_9 TaxID=1975046 RepID=A0A2H0BMF3_9BACT|nr:MAG: hypothetical protein BK005_02010 [bacterium CG10_37_50]PIP58168.1 MAG: hypothetical protein COX02_01850 [Candidatus Vogelbacteria bacterium CG22_combo_CG10-13_8_21_14_all_37_9]